MNARRWSWVLLAAVGVASQGCLLVQPLDDAKPNGSGAGGATSSGGQTSSGGKAGGSADAGGKGGAAPTGRAGGGPVASGGSGGYVPSSLDLSYFTGDWTVTSGTITTDCGSGPVDSDADTGTMERIDLGTTSDLIADEGTQCPVLFDLQNKVSGVAQPGQTCDFTTTAGTYHLEISTFTFVIASNHETALSHLTGVTSLTTNGVTATCNSEQSLNYTR